MVRVEPFLDGAIMMMGKWQRVAWRGVKVGTKWSGCTEAPCPVFAGRADPLIQQSTRTAMYG